MGFFKKIIGAAAVAGAAVGGALYVKNLSGKHRQ